MPEGIITTGQNPAVIATLIAKRALPRLKSATVAHSICDPSYAAEVAEHGESVTVAIPAEYSSNLLADGGTVQRQQTSLGNAQITLDTHREITFAITDRNSALTRPDIKGTNLGQALANMAEDIDEDLLGVYAQFSTTDVGVANTPLTEAVIDSAETTLFNQRVPDGMRKSVVLTGNGYSTIRQIPRFTEAQMIAQGSRPIADGFVGRLKNMDFYRAQKTNVTSVTTRHGVCLAPPALLVAVRPLGRRAEPGSGAIQVEVSEDNITLRLTMSYDANYLGEQTTIDVLYGFVSGRTNFGVEVLH